VGGGLVKAHRCGQFGQARLSRTLLADELEDVDGAIQHLNFISRLLRAFDRIFHVQSLPQQQHAGSDSGTRIKPRDGLL
jgi:hypothetical protein